MTTKQIKIIDDELHRALKVQAAARGMTLQDYVSALLRHAASLDSGRTPKGGPTAAQKK